MPLFQSVESCFPALDRGLFDASLAVSERALANLRGQYEDGSLPLLRLPEERADIDAARALADQIASKADHVVVLGIGGSSLGAKALQALAPHSKPQLHIWENLDPLSMTDLLDRLPLSRTQFVVISKSGTTAETLAQCLSIMGLYDEAGRKAHFAAITEPGDRPLRALAQQYGWPVLDHHTGVGGRFAVLTNVGLLPALLMGLDPIAIRDGAAAMLEPILKAMPAGDVPSAVGAALAHAAMGAGLNQSVLMGYADRFETLIFWYRQLWAESLGKDGFGSTPLNGVGPVDQHSQLQLYLAGPADKLYTVMTTDVAATGLAIPEGLFKGNALDYLTGTRVGDLVDAEQRATIDTLRANARPVRTMHIPALNEESIGAVMMHFMLETIITAALLGVDPYDQPAVEEGKVRARAYLASMKGQQ